MSTDLPDTEAGGSLFEEPFPSDMDGATPHVPPLQVAATDTGALAADLDAPLQRRLEAYEDIIDSEVGDTLMTRARNIEREHGLKQLYVKFEGGNPTGTQKDRIAFAQAMDALRRGYEAVTVATCGNYGASISLAASLAGLKCLVFIPKSYQSKRLDEILSHGASIVWTSKGYEAAVERSRCHAAKYDLYDANPGGSNLALQLQAYGQISEEIYDELRDAPAIVAVPVSNGTTLAGIHRGFLSLHRRGKTSRMPRILAGSSFRKNPIVAAFLKNSHTCEDLPPEGIRETRVNEALVNWHSIDGEVALEAVRSTGGCTYHVSDRRMMALSRLLQEREGLHVLPASTAGLHALLSYHSQRNLPGDRYVVVLTGRKQ